MRDKLQSFFLDYLNNWLTVSAMAEHYNISFVKCMKAIDLGMKIHFKRSRPDMTIQNI